MAKSIPRVYIDSCVYLDLITRSKDLHKDTQEPRWKSARQLFDAVNADKIQLAASPLVEAEVTCHGITREKSEAVRAMLRGYFDAQATIWVDIDRFLAREAVEVMNKHRQKSASPNKMRSADAIHVAASIRLSCGYLLTHDEGFPIEHEVDGVRVLRPQVVWEQDLLEVSEPDQL